MREFYLINAKGSRLSLNEEDMFLSDPAGLGMAYESEYKNIENDFYKTMRKIAQKEISGTMNFTEYAGYKKFIDFIQEQPLTLEYKADGDTYYIDGYIDSISKGEIDVFLECPLSFKTTTNFYKRQTYVLSREHVDNSKQYNYSYPYTYNDTSGGAMQYINDTALKHPAKIIIEGYAKKPHWQLMQNKEVLLDGRVNVTIEEGHKLVIESDPAKMEIAEYTKDNEYIANRYAVSDFTTKRFLSFPPGTTELSFSHEAENELKIYLEVREEHESV